jgi:Leucine-rich repeat (LRR) protein
MTARGVSPLSLLFSAQTQVELALYLHLGLGSDLPGRLELVDARWNLASLGHWVVSARYDGCGQVLHLPEGLVIDSALTLLDWKVPVGWPQGLHSVGPLCLERCAGNLAFPSGFHVGGGFRASQCSGLANLPQGDLNQVMVRDCDLPAFPAQDELKELSLVNCSSLSGLGDLPELERLNLYRCPALAVVPTLPKLKSLCLGGVPQLPVIQANPALKTVHLRGLRRLRSLPDAFATVPNLILDGLEQLDSLEGLQSPMESLSILRCPSLTSLPQSLRAGKLVIEKCPHLRPQR